MKPDTMKVAAHRGFSGRYPENTMLAFRKAVEEGADEIELDVQLSKDGQVVVFHDESLERLTGIKGWIRDYSFDELVKFDTAKIVFGNRHGFNPIPSLEEYFSWVRNTGIVTNIELKNGRFYYEGLEEKTIELISRFGLEERVFFSSFNHVSLMKCKKIKPVIRCGVLVGGGMAPGNPGYYVRSNGLDFYHPDIKSVNDEVVANCKTHEVGINVWTVDDMDSLLKMQEWGCRGVITNFPGMCGKCVKGNGDRG